MSEEIIVKYCSPTLAGLKTGNMFSCIFSNATKMRESVRRWNQLLRKKGLRVLPLRYCNHRALIYVYRPSYLSRDLQHEIAHRLLKERGYGMKTPEHCIVHLVQRMQEYEEFPHEVGLFLGYPPEDVQGFIDNNAKDCKCVGCWKVYNDEEKAKKLFKQYKKCTDIYCAQFAQGKSIERLTVAG